MSSVDLPNRRRATLRQLGQFSRIWSVSRLRRLPCPALWPDSNATARPTRMERSGSPNSWSKSSFTSFLVRRP